MANDRWSLRILVPLVVGCGAAPAGPAAPATNEAAPVADDPLVDGTLAGPAAEAPTTSVKLALPAIPAFDLPPPSADGSHAPRELRVVSKKLLDSEVTIKGFVTWAYDCAAEVRRPGMTDRAVKDLIDRDPTLCERPKFYVGDAATTSARKSLWVVDVPRAYNKLELARIRKAERTAPDRCEPDERDPKKRVCPPYQAGDQVEVTGVWKLASPHAERNSDGLLVYTRMKNLTRRWETPGTPRAPAPPTPPPPIASSVPPIVAPVPAVAKPAPTKVRRSVRDASVAAAAEGTAAYAAKQFDTATERYQQAVDRWHDNHVAWYGLCAAYAQRGDWARAADAAAIAVEVEPTRAMYHLMYGRMLYERAIQRAREDQAKRENRKPEEVELELGTLNFEQPMSQLEQAVALDSGLWRAHYLIGNVLRHAGKSKQAAVEFSRALMAGPTEAAPWIALAELYRQWDYTDQAIAVAQQAVLVVPSDLERSDLWFELGMGYDDKQLDDSAIEAFTKALETRPDNQGAKFSRGQAYFRKGVFDRARRDLEELSKATGPGLALYKQQASRMLMDLAARTPGK